MKDIIPGTVAITTRPRKGSLVTSNEFMMEFEVEVETDGCYVIEFRLLEDDTFSDDVVLENTDAYAAVYCLTAGSRQNFRITTSHPSPTGVTMPPAPAPGTITLPPVQGSWPTDDGIFDDDIELKYEVVVYHIGPCTAGSCSPVLKSDLSQNPYMRLTGPNSGTPSNIQPVEREVASMARIAGERRFMANLGSTFGMIHRRGNPLELASAISSGVPFASKMGRYLTPPLFPENVRRKRDFQTDPLVAANKFVKYELHFANNADTFYEDAVVVTRYLLKDDESRKTARFVVKDIFPTLEELGDALLRIEEAIITKNYRRALVAVTGIVRHGRMIIFDGVLSRSGFFYHDRFNGVWYPGTGPFLAMPIIFMTGASAGVAGSPGTKTKKNETAWMTDEWYVYPFAWLLAGTDYADDIDELISDTIEPAITANECFEEFEILSHGGYLCSSTGTGTITGSFIQMGSDRLRSDDFDANGNLKPGATKTKDLLDKLKAVMCPGGKLIFSACNQEIGDLLKNISRYIDNDVTLIGNSHTGIPEIEGDMKFKNGSAVT